MLDAPHVTEKYYHMHTISYNIIIDINFDAIDTTELSKLTAIKILRNNY